MIHTTIRREDSYKFKIYSVKPFPGPGYKGVPGVGVPSGTDVAPPPPWEGRAIATHKLRLVEFSAFVEHPRDPDTVSLNGTVKADDKHPILCTFKSVHTPR